MIDGSRWAIGEAVKRLGAVVTETRNEVVRRYRGVRNWVGADVSVKESVDVHGRREIDGQGPGVDADAEGTLVRDPPQYLMSADELIARIQTAERSGEPQIATPDHMFSMNSDTTVFVYPDGFEVMCKRGLSPVQQFAEVLTSAVGRAVGAPVPPVVAGTDGAVFMQRLRGHVVSGTRADPGAREVMEALEDTPDARKLGLLDVLVRNWPPQQLAAERGPGLRLRSRGGVPPKFRLRPHVEPVHESLRDVESNRSETMGRVAAE